MSSLLSEGDEQHCERCGAWHALSRSGPSTTTYADAMLYVHCRGQSYYAGNIGTISRRPTRPGATALRLTVRPQLD